VIADDIPDLAVKALLVTYDFKLKDTESSLRNMARSLCQNFSVLQENGHPKWREVELKLPVLGRGWFYYGPTAGEIRSCAAELAKVAMPVKSSAVKAFAQNEMIFGLCKRARLFSWILVASGCTQVNPLVTIKRHWFIMLEMPGKALCLLTHRLHCSRKNIFRWRKLIDLRALPSGKPHLPTPTRH